MIKFTEKLKWEINREVVQILLKLILLYPLLTQYMLTAFVQILIYCQVKL